MVGYFTSPSFYTMSILAVPASHGWRDTKILSAEGWVCCRRCTKVWVSSHLPIQGLVWTLTSFFQGSEYLAQMPLGLFACLVPLPGMTTLPNKKTAMPTANQAPTMCHAKCLPYII